MAIAWRQLPLPSILPIFWAGAGGGGIRHSSPPGHPILKNIYICKNEIVGHFPIFSTNLHFTSNIFSRDFPNIVGPCDKEWKWKAHGLLHLVTCSTLYRSLGVNHRHTAQEHPPREDACEPHGPLGLLGRNFRVWVPGAWSIWAHKGSINPTWTHVPSPMSVVGLLENPSTFC